MEELPLFCDDIDNSIILVNPDKSSELDYFQKYMKNREISYRSLKKQKYKIICINNFTDWFYLLSVILEHKYEVFFYKINDGYSFTIQKDSDKFYYLFEFKILIPQLELIDNLVNTILTHKSTFNIYQYYVDYCNGKRYVYSDSSI